MTEYIINADINEVLNNPKFMHPSIIRSICRLNKYNEIDKNGHGTSCYASGYVQANLVMLPKKYAFDFLLFCQRNPKPCPLLHVIEGEEYDQWEDKINGHNINVFTDLPSYRIYKDGKLVGTKESIEKDLDLVTFLLGCSFSFEDALSKANLIPRHITQNKNVPMYKTNIKCQRSGVFNGNMVVSMRPYTRSDSLKVCDITAQYPKVHGAPIYIGDPSKIGISDISKPDYGDSVDIYTENDEIPCFWACGVTPQEVVLASKPSYCITHSPGFMLLLNEKNEDLAKESSVKMQS